jgi:hypothetical protein
MSNAIVQALEDAARKVVTAVEDAARSAGHFVEDTGTRLRAAARDLTEHDGKAAAELERAGRHGDETPTIHGGGSSVTHPSFSGGRGPDVVAETDRAAKFGRDVKAGYGEKSANPRTSGQFPPGYDPLHGRTGGEYLAQYSDGTWNKYGDPNWNWSTETTPTGALGNIERETHVPQDAILDRYGESHGKFLSPDGTGYPQRGLPASNLAEGYHRYRVLKPLPANEGVIGPAFGEPGGGLQYRLTESVQWYIDNKYLEEITP